MRHGCAALKLERRAAEIVAMAQASRPLLLVVVLAFVLVTVYLLVAPLTPQPPERSHTPFAPVQALEPARGVSAASDAANAQRQAAADAVDAP